MKSIDNKAAFGLTIKGIRNLKRLTQEDLSELSGIAPYYISNVERGNVNPTLNTIILLSKALKVEPSDIFALAFSPESEKRKELKSSFLVAVNKLDDTEIDILLKMVSALI